ncbi:MAG: hypothetical protein RJB17_1860, partial [Pseudomonadota bacterium]
MAGSRRAAAFCGRLLPLQKSLLLNYHLHSQHESTSEIPDAAGQNSCGLLPGRHHNLAHNQRERSHVIQVGQLTQKCSREDGRKQGCEVGKETGHGRSGLLHAGAPAAAGQYRRSHGHKGQCVDQWPSLSLTSGSSKRSACWPIWCDVWQLMCSVRECPCTSTPRLFRENGCSKLRFPKSPAK